MLVDDHPLFREGLRGLIENESDMSVVGEASTGREAISLARTHNPDVVLMDIGLPGLDGLSAARAILGDDPAVRVITLTGSPEEAYAAESLRVGAAGFLLKGSTYTEVARAIRVVAQGGRYLGDALSASPCQPPAAAADAPLCALTERERDVLRMMAEGMTTKEISGRLGIGCKTVETHQRRLKAKLGIANLARLTRLAVCAGLVPLDPKAAGS